MAAPKQIHIDDYHKKKILLRAYKEMIVLFGCHRLKRTCILMKQILHTES
jgi:hypothetical protein